MKKSKEIFGVVIVLILVTIGIRSLNSLMRPTSTDGAYNQVISLRLWPEDTVDAIVLGSSHAFCGVDTMVFYEKYGIGAVNYAYYWQNIDVTRLFLVDSLEITKPKVVLIEAGFVDRTHEDCDLDPQIFYTRYLGCKDEVRKFLKKCFGSDLERWLSYYMPVWMFHEEWANIPPEAFVPIERNPSISKRMAGKRLDGSKPIVLSENSTVEQYELSEASIEELNQMVMMCRENNVKVVFFTLPYEGEYNYSDAMREYALANDCEYIDFYDFLENVEIDCETDFYDAEHLNTQGAKKVSEYLGACIDRIFALRDMRQVENNPWEKSLEN